MTYLGIDSAASISASAAKILRENGISFVGRYLVPAGMGKDLTAAEIKNIHGAGLAILPCWEIEAAAVKEGAERGAKDGARAKQLAMQYGMPTGTSIYFACDYYATQAEYPMIEAYILAAQQACYPFVAGLYGHAGIVDYLGSRDTCKRFWQCVAWSGGRISKYTNVYQYQWQGGPDAQDIYKRVGFYVDMNRCENLEAAGLWFSAEEKHWYDEAMAWGERTGIMRDGRPNDTLTRAEAITMLMRYHNIFAAEDDKTASGLLSD